VTDPQMRAVEIERLSWDSAFFSKRIGRLRPDPDRETDLRRVADLDRSGFDCLYVELDVAAADLLDRWLALGARVMDVRAELSAVVGEAAPVAAASEVEGLSVWSESDRQDAAALAEDLSRWSRFARDPALRDSAARLYGHWLELAISGAHEALVWRAGGHIVGLLTFRSEADDAWIELLDIHESHRGQGIALALMRAFLARAHRDGRTRANVRTQLRNLRAVHAYERAGFRIGRVTLVLHWWSH